MDSLQQVPFRPIDFLSRDVSADRRPDGTIVLQSNHRLKPYERHVSRFSSPSGRPRHPVAFGWRSARGPGREWLKVT